MFKSWHFGTINISIVLLLILLLPAAVYANTNTPAFSAQATKQLYISWHGKPLVTGDYIKSVGLKAFDTPDGSQTENIHHMVVSDIWHKATDKKPVAYRREVATNGKKIELAVQFRIPSYYDAPADGGDTYHFSVPIDRLAGMDYKAVTGRGTVFNIKKGKITANMPDGKIIYTRFIAFSDPTGNRPGLVFDFNPKGPSAFNDYGPTVLQGYWRIDKHGDKLDFYFGRAAKVYGQVINSIIRIHEGKFSDYDKYHAHRTYHYYDTLPAIKQLSFGKGTPSKGWENGNKSYTKSRGFGWLNTKGLHQVGNINSDVLRGMVQGSTKHTLRIDVPEPGLYVVTVRIGSPNKTIGPFTLTANNQVAAKNIIVKPGKIRNLTFSRYPTKDNPKITLSWSGKNWAVSTVALQAMVYQPQDFAIKRGVWLMDNIPTPTDLFMFKRHPVPAAAVSEITDAVANPAPNAKVESVTMKPLPIVAPSGNNPARAWRWKGSITSLGPSNFGSFYEFETKKQINRRLDQIQALGYSTILLNGLLIRHDYPKQLPRVTKTVARIAKLAHARGMHVLDHQDLSLMPTQGAGLKLFADHIGWMQRDVRNGLPTRGLDLTNPNFLKHYWKNITEYIKATNIDGLMIDETNFHGEMYSGSEYARQQFYKATGIHLPTGNLKSVIMNKSSHLWRLWLRWRMRAVSNWFIQLRKQVEKVNPNFVLMKYTTPYGLLSNYSTIGFGGGLIHAAKGADWLGTEIMSRNVYATYRANYAFRGLFSSLHDSFGAPVFGLVYPIGQPAYAYAAWAMNNMHDQATWSITRYKAISEDSKRYINWPENMNLRHANHIADTAVLFSTSSRDFPKYFSYYTALSGTLQQLNDMHIPNDVLLSRDIKISKLKKYKLLIIPSACSMSNEHLNTILFYLKQGGHVLSLGHTAVLNQLGFDRKIWPLGRWLGLKFAGILHKEKYQLTGPTAQKAGEVPIIFNYGLTHVLKDSSASVQSNIIMRAKYKNTDAIAAASRKIGKGYLLYVSPRLGAAVVQRMTTAGKKWTYKPKPKLQSLLSEMINKAYGNQTRLFKAIKMPTTVYSNVFREPSNVAKGIIKRQLIKDNNNSDKLTLVHLYNGSGVKHEIGKPIPKKQPDNPFPVVQSKMIFNISMPKATRTVTGLYTSPDNQTPKQGVKVNVKKLEGNMYQVTIPNGTLHAYGIVYLKQKKP